MDGKPKRTDYIKLTCLFLASGAISGLIFGWIITSTSFTGFFFITGEKFLIPKSAYVISREIIFTTGLIISYILARLFGWLQGLASQSAIRYILAALITTSAAAAMEVTDTRFLDALSSSITWFLFAQLLFIFLYSLSLWLLTSRWNSYIVLLMVVALALSLMATVAVYKVLHLSNDLYDIVYFVLRNSSLSALCGYWLIASIPSIERT